MGRRGGGSRLHPSRFAAAPLEVIGMYRWEPYTPSGALFCVVEASCCEEFVLSSEGGTFFIRRRADDGGWVETARGGYYRAAKVWMDLARGHQHERRTAS